VLEEMREAAFAGLDFVAGADADHDVNGGQVGVIGGDGDEAKAVGKGVEVVFIGEKRVCRSGAPKPS
jgi:hypothetical protein